MELTQFVLGSLGLTDYRLRLSKSDPTDPKYQGAAGETWQKAEADIRAVLDEMQLALRRGPRRGRVLRPEGRLSWSATASAASGNSGRSSSTTSCPSGSACTTRGPTTCRTGR